MKTRHYFGIIAGLIILISNISAFAIEEKLPEGFYPISTIKSDGNFKELKPIGDMIGHSKFVALGEAHHTSNGFYQAKFHLIQYLIKDLGFRTIAFENDWNSILPVDDFLMHGKGDVKSILMNFYPVWRSDTVLEMLNWIRQFNQENPGDPVRMLGFDMQNLPASSTYIINALESKQRQYIRQGIINCNNVLPFHFNEKVQTSDCRTCLLLSSKLLDSAGPFLNEFPYFQVAALSLQSSYARSCSVTDDQQLMIRDEAMAKILPLMAEHISPHSRTIIWAANGHIHKKSFSPNTKSMGVDLVKKLGNDYKTILLVASRYETNKEFDFIKPQLSAPPDSLEAWLGTFGKEYLFVNFHNVSRSILEIKDDDENVVLQDSDGVFYLKQSPAMIMVK